MSPIEAFAEQVKYLSGLQEYFEGIETEEELVERVVAVATEHGYGLDAEAVRQRLRMNPALCEVFRAPARTGLAQSALLSYGFA